jgi:hypothetical protein
MYNDMQVPLAQRLPLETVRATNPGLIAQLEQHTIPTPVPLSSLPAGASTLSSTGSLQVTQNSSDSARGTIRTTTTASKANASINTEAAGSNVAIIGALYENSMERCNECALRFPTKDGLSTHLDWHFRTNRRRVEGSSASARFWFVALKDWTGGIRLASVEARGECAAATFFDVQKAESEAKDAKARAEARGGEADAESEGEQRIARWMGRVPGSTGVPLDERFPTCPTCGEAFEREWYECVSKTQEEKNHCVGKLQGRSGGGEARLDGVSQWIWKRSVRPPATMGNVEGLIFHRECFESLRASPRVVDATRTEVIAAIDIGAALGGEKSSTLKRKHDEAHSGTEDNVEHGVDAGKDNDAVDDLVLSRNLRPKRKKRVRY